MLGFKECGESKGKVRGFLPELHAMYALLLGGYRQVQGCARNECGMLAQSRMMSGAHGQSMKSCICLTAQTAAVAVAGPLIGTSR